MGLHQWVNFERGMWAGLDGRLIDKTEGREFCTGYAAGREILQVMNKRGQYVANPETEKHLRMQLGRAKAQITRERRKTEIIQRHLDETLLALSAARRGMGSSLDRYPIRSEVTT